MPCLLLHYNCTLHTDVKIIFLTSPNRIFALPISTISPEYLPFTKAPHNAGNLLLPQPSHHSLHAHKSHKCQLLIPQTLTALPGLTLADLSTWIFPLLSTVKLIHLLIHSFSKHLPTVLIVGDTDI